MNLSILVAKYILVLLCLVVLINDVAMANFGSRLGILRGFW